MPPTVEKTSDFGSIEEKVLIDPILSKQTNRTICLSKTTAVRDAVCSILAARRCKAQIRLSVAYRCVAMPTLNPRAKRKTSLLHTVQYSTPRLLPCHVRFGQNMFNTGCLCRLKPASKAVSDLILSGSFALRFFIFIVACNAVCH